jgi:hypothetical protein
MQVVAASPVEYTDASIK